MQFQNLRTTRLLAGFRIVSGWNQGFISQIEAGQKHPLRKIRKRLLSFSASQLTSVLRTPKLGSQKSVFMGLSEGDFWRVFLTLL